MRSTLEIIIAVKESQPVTEEELRLALLVMTSMEHFVRRDLQALIEAVEEGKPTAKLRAGLTRQTLEQLFQGRKKDPAEWLGPGNIPGTAEYARRHAQGMSLLQKAERWMQARGDGEPSGEQGEPR